MKSILIFFALLILMLNYSTGQSLNTCKEEIYVDVENGAKLEGDSTFESLIRTNIQIPKEYLVTYRNLFFEFVVDSSGIASDIKFLNEISRDSSLVSQLYSLITKSNWKPGIISDKKVCQQLKYSLIINEEVFVPKYSYSLDQKNILLKELGK